MSVELPVIESESSKASCCRLSPYTFGVFVGVTVAFIGAAFIGGLGFFLGRATLPAIELDSSLTSSLHEARISNDRIPPELLRATATHGGNNIAVCTAWIDDDSEGFFALDYNTGDLKCWVYYPRQGGFGGLFMTNVQPILGMSKNPEYLLVSGGAVPSSVGGNVRPASSLVYVVDTKSGFFAAYTIPWNRTMESSSAMQGGQIIFVGGGIVREPQSGVKKPVAPPPAIIPVPVALI